MSKAHRNTPVLPYDLFAVKQRKTVPHEFVLDAIAALSPKTRHMFGCLAVYVEDKIVLVLRDKRDKTADNGVWLATTEEHHESLRRIAQGNAYPLCQAESRKFLKPSTRGQCPSACSSGTQIHQTAADTGIRPRPLAGTLSEHAWNALRPLRPNLP